MKSAALKRSSYWKDVAWLISGNAVATAVGIAAMPLLTRLYLPQHFALLALFTQILGFLSVVQTARYEYLIHLPREQEEARALLVLVFWIGLVACLVETPLVWLARWPLSNLVRNPELGTWLVLLPVTASLLSCSVALENYAQRRNEFRHASFSDVANKCCYVGCALIGHVTLPLPAGLMLATTAGSAAKAGWLGFPAAWREFTSRGPGRVREMAGSHRRPLLRRVALTYLKLSRSMVASHLLQNGSVLIPSFFVMRYYGAAEMGQFALVVGTISLPTTLIATSVGKVFYQRSADLWANGNSFAALWRETFRKVLYLGLPLYLVVVVAAPRAYPLIFGGNWVDAGRYGSVMAVSAFCSFISTPMDRGCFIVSAGWYILLWNTLRAATVGVVVLLAWYYGWSMRTFIVALTAQMSLMYLVDLVANHRFAHRVPAHPPVPPPPAS